MSTTQLHAVSYAGQGDRTVVRLVPAELVEAENLALGSVGLEPRGDREVGTTTVRAVGFPAWPIITDPGNARHALNLVADLELARRHASARAGDVKKRFDTLSTDLAGAAPHFVPTLLEELARIFADAGNSTYAKQYFGKARETERSHNVAVDPQRHREMFREFAGLGVVGAREMTAEAGASLDRYADPVDALDHFLSVCGEMTAAGIGPYSHMARDVRKVAKAAGFDKREADDRLLATVMTGRGFAHAASGLIRQLLPAMAGHMVTHPDSVAALVEKRPDHMGVDDYISLFDASGHLQAMRDTGADYATWLMGLIVEDSYAFASPTPGFYDEIAGTDFSGVHQVDFPRWGTHPALVDALLAAGATIDFDSRQQVNSVDMDFWFREPHGDLDTLADSVHAEGALDIAVGIIGKNLDELLAHSGTRKLLAGQLEKLASMRSTFTGALPTLGTATGNVLKHLADPRLMELAPEAMTELFAFDPAEEAAAAVRAGLLAEFTWPNYEEAYARASVHGDVTVHDTFPHVAVTAGEHLEVTGLDGTVWTGTGPFGNADVDTVHTVGDTGFVRYQERSQWKSMYWWFGDTVAQPVEGYRARINYSGVPVEGGRFIGTRVVTPGTEYPDAGGSAIHDLGDCYATVDGWAKKVLRFDRRTGEFIGERVVESIVSDLGYDAPGGLFDKLGVDADGELSWYGSEVMPLPDGADPSVVGSVDGRLVTLTLGDGHRWNSSAELITPLGRVRDNSSTERFVDIVGSSSVGLLALPGTSGGSGNPQLLALRHPQLLALRQGTTVAPDTTAYLSKSFTADGSQHSLHMLPRGLWFAASARDPEASALMRTYSAEQATQALDVLLPDRDRELPAAPSRYYHDRNDAPVTVVNSAADAPVRSVLADQLGTDAGGAVIDALTHVFADVAALDATFTELRNTAAGREPDGRSQSSADTSGHHLTEGAVLVFHPRTQWQYSVPSVEDSVIDQVSWLKVGDGSADTAPPHTRSQLVTLVPEYIGREKLLPARWSGCVTPSAETEGFQVAIDLVDRLIDDGALGGDWTVVTVAAPDDDTAREELVDGRSAWVDLGAPVHMISNQKNHYTPFVAGSPVQVVVKEGDVGKLGVSVLHRRDPADRLNGEELRERLRKLATKEPHDVDPEQAAALAEKTGLSTFACRILLGGVWGPPHMDKDMRARYGMNVKEIDQGFGQLMSLGDDLLDELQIALYDGRALPVTAGELRLTDDEWATAEAVPTGYGTQPRETLTKMLLLGEDDVGYPPNTLPALLAIIAQVPLDDPRRPRFADLLEKVVGLCREWAKHPDIVKQIGDMDLGAPYDDPAFTAYVNPESQAVRVATEGLLDGLVDDLRTVYPDLPGVVPDPACSVPDVVDDARKRLGVSAAAARLFLQLLALAYPSDANIRSWNGWRKKNIDAAAAELVEAGLVVEATRKGAGRSRFLPGGWLEGRGGYMPSKPMEVWKVPMYLLWQDTKVSPILLGCPPHMPVQELFRTAWQRYTSGDTPGYEELTTTRYRRR